MTWLNLKKVKPDYSRNVGNNEKTVSRRIKRINKNFNEVFRELFEGGRAEIVLADPQNVLECDIDIIAQPPGKKFQNMLLLSGGERAMTAIALLFAILKLRPVRSASWMK